MIRNTVGNHTIIRDMKAVHIMNRSLTRDPILIRGRQGARDHWEAKDHWEAGDHWEAKDHWEAGDHWETRDRPETGVLQRKGADC
ncbi:Uncharacterised protein [uncultured Clostridium sp.]|nr:Uncharacterised protein [uncultured Clostridium sp.]